MRPKRIFSNILILLTTIILLCFTFLSSCNSPSNDSPTTVVEIPTSTLPDPNQSTKGVPDVKNVVSSFLNKWKNDNYSDMYELLAIESQNVIAEDAFSQLYSDFAGEITLTDLEYDINEPQINPNQSSISYEVIYKTLLFGDLQRTMQMQLVLEDEDWKIVWDSSLIMPDLENGNTIKRDSIINSRAGIFDANEESLASQAEAVAVGLWTDYVYLDESEGLLSLLSRISGLRVDTLIGLIENSTPGEYLPIAEVYSDQFENVVNALSGYSAIQIGRYESRFYPDGGIAPHIVGYISAIQQEEVNDFRKLGYESFEKIGRDGIENWGEPHLIGDRGGTLNILDQEGKVINQIAQASASPGKNIYTTLDSDFQQEVQKSIDGLRGAVVVLERDSGKVLAMASSPKYNPNAFQTENINWDSLLQDIYNDPTNPLFNRASQGQYPLGSVFKIITMAAALESGLYTSETPYECGYFFEEAIGLDLHDWTYDWYLEDGETQPSGLLNLVGGLIRSCNPYFWHIGLDLYNQGLTTAVSDMARGFGLGSATGIIGIPEEEGNIPDPNEPVDAINISIGQGDVLVTPLQVARFVAALGNGGKLMTPWVVDRIQSPDGTIIDEFGPEEAGVLPVDQDNLEIIQEAMEGVVFSQDPRGTAYKVFRDFKIPIAGKTGTAEAGALDPHAWFVGYSMAEREEKPDIAVAVLVENVGEGSEWAAPIFRRIMEIYFFGTPQRLYPWEAAVGVTKTPTPLYTDTPLPEGN